MFLNGLGKEIINIRLKLKFKSDKANIQKSVKYCTYIWFIYIAKLCQLGLTE